jgi:hypothetical protein
VTVTLFDDGVKARHDKMVGLVEPMLKLHKDLPKARTATDRQIDQLVYELYGLTEAEVGIIGKYGDTSGISGEFDAMRTVGS